MLSRRGFFGAAAGAVAVVAGGVTPAEPSYLQGVVDEWGCTGLQPVKLMLSPETRDRYKRMTEFFRDVRGHELPAWPYPPIEVAADLPIPPPGITTADMRAAIKALDARKRAPQKKFEDMLSAPIGKGRLE